MAWIVRTAVVAVVVLAVLLLLVWLAQRSLIYFPDRSEPAPPSDAEPVALRTGDGLDLTAWSFAPAEHADRDAAILVTPGNGGNRAGRADLGRGLAAAGFTVLLLDYRGYGGNPGSPSQDGLYADARAGWDHLSERFDPDRIVLFGESLGAAVATGLSTQVEPAALVLRSPFTSLADAGREHYPVLPVGLLLRDRYPVAEDLAANQAPVTIVFSEHDEVVPAGHSRDVAAAAEASGAAVTVVVIDAPGHNDPALASGPELIDAVTELADAAGLETPTPD